MTVSQTEPLPTAGGIGGAAPVQRLVDVPVGVAGINAVIRFTVLSDSDEFQVPPLLPISFLESVDAVIDTKNDMLYIMGDQSSPLRRLPSRHRATNILNFSPEGWNLPVENRRDPQRDPFVLLPHGFQSFAYAQVSTSTVSVWLLHQDVLHHVHDLPGSRLPLVLPAECAALQDSTTLEPERVTYALMSDGHTMVVRDYWRGATRSLENPWTGAVVFASTSSKLVDNLFSGGRATCPLRPPSSTSLAFPSLSPSTSSQSSSRPRVSWSNATRNEPYGPHDHGGVPDYVDDGDSSSTSRNLTMRSSQSSRMQSPVVGQAVETMTETTFTAEASHQVPCQEFFIGEQVKLASEVDRETQIAEEYERIQDYEWEPSSQMSLKAASQKADRFPKCLMKVSSISHSLQNSDVTNVPSLSSEPASLQSSTRSQGGDQPREEISQSERRMEALGVGHFPDLQECSKRNGHGVPEKPRAGILRCPRRRDQGEEEAHSRKGNGSRNRLEDGNREAVDQVGSTEGLAVHHRHMPPQKRILASSSGPWSTLVHMSSMWSSLGATSPGRILSKLFYHGSSSDFQPTGISQDRSSTEVPYRPESECRNQGAGQEQSTDADPSDQDQGKIRGDGARTSSRTALEESESPGPTNGKLCLGQSGRFLGCMDDGNGRSGTCLQRGSDGAVPFHLRRQSQPGRSRPVKAELKGQERLRHEDDELFQKAQRKAPFAFVLMITFATVFSDIEADAAANAMPPEVIENSTFALCSDRDEPNPSIKFLSDVFGEPKQLFIWTDQDQGWQPYSFVSPQHFAVTSSGHFDRVTACWTYETNASNHRLGLEDHTWNRSPKTIPKAVKTFLAEAVSSTYAASQPQIVDIAEIYSVPRMTQEAQHQNEKGKSPPWRVGFALDLRNGYDLSKKSVRDEVWKLIKKHKPALLVLSPPCTVISTLRRLSNHKRPWHIVKREEEEGRQHWLFVLDLARYQKRHKRGFLLEHPAYAVSWDDESLQDLYDDPDVYFIVVHMCEFQLRTRDGFLAKKPDQLVADCQDDAETSLSRQSRSSTPTWRSCRASSSIYGSFCPSSSPRTTTSPSSQPCSPFCGP